MNQPWAELEGVVSRQLRWWLVSLLAALVVAGAVLAWLAVTQPPTARNWLPLIVGAVALLWAAISVYRLRALTQHTLNHTQFLGRIIEQAPVGLWGVDRTGHTRFANAAAITGIQGQEAEPLRALGDGDDALAPQLERAWAGAVVQAQQTLHAGSTCRHFESNAYRVSGSTPDSDMVVIAQHEVTQHHDTVSQLRQSEARLRTILDGMHAPVSVITPHGEIVEVNRAWLQTNELSRTDVIGKGIDTVPGWLPSTRSQMHEALQRASLGEVVRFETEIRHSPQRAMTLDVTFSPVELPSGLAALFVGSPVDMTERQRADTERDRRLIELEAVQRVSAAMRAALSLDEMLPRLLDETLAVLKTEPGAIWFYDGPAGSLRFTVERGWCTRFSQLHLNAYDGLPGYVHETRQPYVASDFFNDPRLHDAMRAVVPAGWGGACVPIRITPEVIGAFFIAVRSPREMTSDEIRLLTTLADVAGNAIQRLQLHQQTEQRVQNLAALRAIDVAINSSLDLRLTLNVVIDQVMAQLDVDAADILLLDTPSQTLEYAVGRGFRTAMAEQPRMRLGEGRAGRVALERKALHLPYGFATGSSGPRTGLLMRENLTDYFAVPLIAKGQVKGVLEIFQRTLLTPTSEWRDFLDTLAGQAAIAIDNAQLFESLQRANTELALAYDTTLEGWARALDLRDRETEGHTRRVTDLTVRLARAIGIPEADIVHIRRGAILHDIGKMGVPDDILRKTGPLTDQEWGVMRRHPQYAFDMLSPIAYLRPALDIPYCHHERWDGSGYPRGLQQEQIPLAARVFTVVDVWDALRSDRPYRAGLPKEEVREHLKTQAGKYFDPRAVEVFLMLVDNELRTTA
jgi:PAS domain S-box-containing protein